MPIFNSKKNTSAISAEDRWRYVTDSTQMPWGDDWLKSWPEPAPAYDAEKERLRLEIEQLKQQIRDISGLTSEEFAGVDDAELILELIARGYCVSKMGVDDGNGRAPAVAAA